MIQACLDLTDKIYSINYYDYYYIKNSRDECSNGSDNYKYSYSMERENMQYTKTRLIYFSPTRTSQKVVEAIGSGFSEMEMENIDLTYPDFKTGVQLGSDELAIIGVPVYAGRVAAPAVERLKAIKGSNTPVILVVLYGNREYEDALIELRDLALKNSFIPIAACAFIGEHSFSSSDMPIAEGRPDDLDLVAAKDFGGKVFSTLSALADKPQNQSVEVPGDRPYKAGMGFLPFTPMVDHLKCTQCGECVATCPSGAIALHAEIAMDVELCIFCCACIKNCPEGAVKIDAAPLQQKQQWLHDNCGERKDPEFFL